MRYSIIIVILKIKAANKKLKSVCVNQTKCVDTSACIRLVDCFKGFILFAYERSYFRYRQYSLENKIQYSPCMVFVYFDPFQ